MPASAQSLQHLQGDLVERLESAEAELRALRAELQRQQRLAMLGTLAAGVAHETNNLLTPVLAYAQLAAARPRDDEVIEKLVDNVMHGVRHATEIADAILGFASARDGDAVSDVATVIDQAMRCLGRDPLRDGVTCHVNIPPGIRAKIAPLALQQVVLNLVLNAVVAMKGCADGDLTISVQQRDGHMAMTISDTGPGLPASVVRHLFEPFTRSETGGNGLGLWICRTLIEQANGRIEASTSPEQGTTFTITLPVYRCAQSGSSTTSSGSTDK